MTLRPSWQPPRQHQRIPKCNCHTSLQGQCMTLISRSETSGTERVIDLPKVSQLGLAQLHFRPSSVNQELIKKPSSWLSPGASNLQNKYQRSHFLSSTVGSGCTDSLTATECGRGVVGYKATQLCPAQLLCCYCCGYVRVRVYCMCVHVKCVYVDPGGVCVTVRE